MTVFGRGKSCAIAPKGRSSLQVSYPDGHIQEEAKTPPDPRRRSLRSAPKRAELIAAGGSQMYIVGRLATKSGNSLRSIHANSWHSMDSVWLGTICGRARHLSVHPDADRDVGRAPYPGSQSVDINGFISSLFDFRDHSCHRSRNCFHSSWSSLNVRRA